MPCILALDQGTTSSRAIAFDDAGRIVATAQREFAQHYPQAGWVEHDAADIWRTQHDVACEVANALRQRGETIAALGVTNQRETTVIWDRTTGKPIHRAIVWQDRRTAERIDQLKARGYDATLRHTTGLVPDAYFSATKVEWLLKHIDGARERAEAGELAFGTIDSWLIHNLTAGAVHVTDATNASRTMLYDIHDQRWDDDLLALFGVPRDMLPQVVTSSEVVGEVAIDSPLRGLPIAGIAGDQQAALVGQLCTRPGMTKNTYGTGCFTLMHTGDKAVRSGNNLLTTLAWRIGQHTAYALEGSVFIGGAVVQWLRDGLGVIDKSSDVEALAASVTDSDGVYFVPAFAGLGAPHWDAYARGTICGLTRGTTAAHIARAAIECIAFQVADLTRAMEVDGGIALAELRADGGAAGDNLLLQFQADLLGKPIVRPRVIETTALGAAYLAGLATGVWRGFDDLADQWQVDRRFEPTKSRDEAAARTARWRRAVDSARGWAR